MAIETYIRRPPSAQSVSLSQYHNTPPLLQHKNRFTPPATSIPPLTPLHLPFLYPTCPLPQRHSALMPSSSTWYVAPDASPFHSVTNQVPMQDGTLTDSIAAVEAAWGKVAKDIGQDPAYVIAATHGKRAVDNLSQFKPHIKSHEMDVEVQAFEETILYFADAYNKHGPGSRQNSPIASPAGSSTSTPALTPAASTPSSRTSSRASSFVGGLSNLTAFRRRPSFLHRVSSLLMMSDDRARIVESSVEEDEETTTEQKEQTKEALHQLQAWQQEAIAIDRSVRILPGVKRMIESIPKGRYAVATSGAKTYGMFCPIGLHVE